MLRLCAISLVYWLLLWPAVVDASCGACKKCVGPHGFRGPDGAPGPPGPAGVPGDIDPCPLTTEILAQNGGAVDPEIQYTELVWYDHAELPLWTLDDPAETGTEKYIALVNDAGAPGQIQTNIGSFLLNPAYRKDAHVVFLDDVWKVLKEQYDYGTWFVDRQQGPRLAISGSISGFGSSVALSADGNTLAAGAIQSGTLAGVLVYVRTLPAGAWAVETFLAPTGEVFSSPDSIDDVAISADGNTIAYGYPENNGGSAGATWVFVRTGPATWVQQAGPLDGVGADSDSQGYSVALDAAGDTLLVGAPTSDGDNGNVFVFVRDTLGAWTQQPPGAPLTFTDLSANCRAGNAVALSSDGNTAAVGGPGCASVGAAFVFTRSGSTWTQQGPRLDYPGPGAGANFFGWDVALAGDGNFLAVGCSTCAVQDVLEFGGAFTYERDPSDTWALVGPGIAPEFDNVGGALALSKDGHSILLGYGKDLGVIGGPVPVYLRSNDDSWAVQSVLVPDIVTTYFGNVIALDSDGRTAATTAWDNAIPFSINTLYVYH